MLPRLCLYRHWILRAAPQEGNLLGPLEEIRSNYLSKLISSFGKLSVFVSIDSQLLCMRHLELDLSFRIGKFQTEYLSELSEIA